MHAIHTAHKLNQDATRSALLGKKLQIAIGGKTYTGICCDVIPNRKNPNEDSLVMIEGVDDYSREWKVVE